MPHRILQILTSIRSPKESVSSGLGQKAVEQLHKKFPDAALTVWDLGHDPLSPLTLEFEIAAHTPLELRSEAQNKLLDDSRMDLLLNNDIYVISLAGYGYDVPAVFKNFLEHSQQYDVTVASDGTPLLQHKKIAVITAWGGDREDIEPEVGYEYILKKSFSDLGLTDVRIFNVYRTDDITSTADEVKTALSGWVEKFS